jgi:hypothetical protein
VRDKWPVVQAEIVHHARYSADVVVAAAYEAYKGLPRILPQDAHTCKLGRLLLEVGVRGGPLLVQLAEVGREVEVVLYEGAGVVIFGSD